MASHFRHPNEEDYEATSDDPVRDGWIACGLDRLSAVGTSMTKAVWGCLLLIVIGMVWAATLTSWFQGAPTQSGAGPVPRAVDPNDAGDVRLHERLKAMSDVAPATTDSTQLWILDDPAINAASFGGRRFVAWYGMSTLTNEDIDAIFAHELAHDALHHSQAAAEVSDVTDFVGEIIGVFSGSDEEVTKTLKRWTGNFIVPHYSRSQEFQADSAAIPILSHRGYKTPAAALCAAFARLQAVAGDGGGGFFDSHPALRDRIAALRKLSSDSASGACGD